MKNFIKAGTPGTFRPEHGEYPELGTRVDSWVLQRDKLVRFTDEFAEDINADFLSGQTVAWSYAPTPPPIDGLEDWRAQWHETDGLHHCTAPNGDYVYSTAGSVLALYDADGEFRSKLGTFPNLKEAQTAAYAHFLQSINDPTQ